MIAKTCSRSKPGGVASTGRNRHLEGQDNQSRAQLVIEYARKVAKPLAK